MRIVLDTNVIISALLWKGLPNRILKLIEEGRLTLCINEFILDELINVLGRPKFKSRIEELNTSVDELIAGILKISEIFPDLKIASVVKDDLEDNWILSCALISKSRYIVTGDPHLLKIKKFHNIIILSPYKFLLLIA
jgi:putative PIN family toxin of toxin-antitoxin system